MIIVAIIPHTAIITVKIIAPRNLNISAMKSHIKESDEVLKLMPVLKEIVSESTSEASDKRYRKSA